MKPGGKLVGKPAGGGGPLGGVLKDKRVLIGAAVAGVLGLVVLLKRGGAPVDAGPDGAVLSPAQLDSSGTDLYNALQGFTDGLADIRDLLGQQPTTGTGSDPAADAPAPTPPGWGMGVPFRRPLPSGAQPAPWRPAPGRPRSWIPSRPGSRPGRPAPAPPASRPTPRRTW